MDVGIGDCLSVFHAILEIKVYKFLNTKKTYINQFDVKKN